jgi:hypothetical protein
MDPTETSCLLGMGGREDGMGSESGAFAIAIVLYLQCHCHCARVYTMPMCCSCGQLVVHALMLRCHCHCCLVLGARIFTLTLYSCCRLRCCA